MRILLDECVNPRLRLAFPGDEVNTVSEMGWRSLSNGELLKQATGFDVFITIDQSVHHQNPTHRFPIGILILLTRANQLAAYRPHFTRIRDAVRQTRPGQVNLLEI
jgi:predicted nuclease of predicted toxin-antitoxin system